MTSIFWNKADRIETWTLKAYKLSCSAISDHFNGRHLLRSAVDRMTDQMMEDRCNLMCMLAEGNTVTTSNLANVQHPTCSKVV